ncbi:MAG: hypothetical protein QOF57_391, partial [Frankiaceae bacterium]|nr:hypothetical protein [Frankiaceae bacterium]
MESAGIDVSVQQRLLLDGAEGRAAAVSRCSLVVNGALDVASLRAAVTEQVTRHEILRTRFEVPSGLSVPVQIIGADPAVAWDDDATDAPLRVRVTTAGDATTVLLTAPATVADAATLTAVGLAAIAAAIGAPVDEPAEPLQYADFAAWQQEMAAAGDAAALAAAAHWRTVTPGRLRVTGDGASTVEVPVPAAAAAAVTALANNAGVTVEDAWLGIWVALAARVTGLEAVTVAVAVDGRQDSELAGAIGPYVLPLPLAVDAIGGRSVADVVRAAAVGRAAAERHALRPPAMKIVADVAFSYDRLPAATSAGGTTVTVTDRVDAVVGTQARFAVTDRDGAVLVAVHAAGADAQRLASTVARHLPALLDGIDGIDATTTVDALPLWTAAERAAVLAAGVADGVELPAVSSFHALIEDAARRFPERPAVVAADATLSYGELDARANQLAHVLRARGAARNVPVGILLDRRADLVVAIFAVLKAGAPYLPLHADHPTERLSVQVEGVGTTIVVSTAELASRLPGGLDIVEIATDLAAGAAESPEPVNEPGDLAYVIYTSGSTGVPKGVGVTHGNLVAYAAAARARLLGDVPADTALSFALVTSVTTDLGNTSLVLALTTGGTLQVVPTEVAVDAAAYALWAAAHPVDVLKITPSHVKALLAAGAGVLPSRLIVVGGEALSWDLVAQLEAAGNCAIANHYGPTETTIGALTYAVARGERRGDTATVPIGRPLAGYRAYVLDAHGEPAPDGVVGELCIGGAGVANGYVGREDFTAERFVADPLGGRMYRTGDLVRRLPDCAVEFLGRVDGQVKIRGYRVEPGEVEAVLEGYDAVTQAAVVALPDPSGDLRLVAYVVGAVASSADVDTIRHHLAGTLPPHMVPSLILPIDAMPLTPNGKLDRRALPDPSTIKLTDESSYVAPRDDVEVTLAAAWAELLGVERVGVEDDFFGLGGHSLLAAQVIARILRDFGVQLPLHSLFVAPTVASLA